MAKSSEIEFSRATADELVEVCLQDGPYPALALALEEIEHARAQRAFLLSEDGQPASTFNALCVWIRQIGEWGRIITSAAAFAWVLAEDYRNAGSYSTTMEEKLSMLARPEHSGAYDFMTSTLRAKEYIRRVLGDTRLNYATDQQRTSRSN